MTSQQARQLAEQKVKSVIERTYEHVASAVYVGHNSDGYWVTDNGEEVSNLTKEQAIEVIVENLTAE